MDDHKLINPREFKDVGFLQEANRLFFHPHGMALAITRVTDGEGAPIHSMALRSDEYDELCALLTSGGASAGLVEKIHGAAKYDVGDAWISGVWDSRDDPEGVIFGDRPEDKTAKAERVEAERKRHYEARCALFGVPRDIAAAVVGADIEPLGWVYVDEESPNE